MNPYPYRRYILSGIIILVFLVIATKLFFLQIINTEYKYSADAISQRVVIEYPARGLIYDRNGELLVSNQTAYDIKVDRFKIAEFDTMALCDVLGISKAVVEAKIAKIKRKPGPFMTQMPPEVYARFYERLDKFPGFYAEPRTLRKYERKIAPHLMGYVAEVDTSEMNKDPYYELGDYIGKSGIEKYYEKDLRGKKGRNIYFVDRVGRIKGSFKSGKFDQPSEVGSDIVCTIDADLQAYGEKLMRNFTGSVVAVEPATGEILALVSSPGYDPEMLVGRRRTVNYPLMQLDTNKPLFNRALMAQYPPGSTFKPINGLIGLQEGVVTPSTTYLVQGGFRYGSFFQKDHVHGYVNFHQAIEQSSNAYFSKIFMGILENDKYDSYNDAYDKWRSYLVSIGFSNKLGIDLPIEAKGNVPKHEYYEKIYNGRWKPLNIISMAIGQGELLTTPLQMANMTAVIANKGWFYTPHVVKEIKNGELEQEYKKIHRLEVDPEHFEHVIKGMDMVVNSEKGTAYFAKLEDVTICGKTGTAENPHGDKDHSIFVAFAPRENPVIALAVYIELGGFGSVWAAPVASLMIEQYLTGEIKRQWYEQRILEADLTKEIQ